MITTEFVKSIPQDSRALGTNKRLYGSIHTSTVGKAFIRDHKWYKIGAMNSGP